jgi:pantoate--beta-alanine ligase
MVQDLDFPLEIVVCPTVREPDGLAMSSRNVYLGTDERKAATALFRALEAARAAHAGGERDAGRLRAAMSAVLAREPLVAPVYVSLADPETLAELDGPVEKGLLSLAARVGKPVLIDNMVIGER